MSAIAPAADRQTAAGVSEVTRFMCSSVFLGHDADIRKKLRAYVADRYHAVAESPGLDVRLLARVLDFYDQRKLRHAAWHGPLGLVVFLMLTGMYVAASADVQPLILMVIAGACLVFGIAAYRQHMRNHYGYALQSFARDNFNAAEVGKRFKNSRAKFEDAIPNLTDPGNVMVYGAFDPFVGAGGVLGDWSLVIDTRKGKEGEAPVSFTAQDLEDAIHRAFRNLPIPNLQLSERLFVHGTDVGLIDGLLPDRFARPVQNVDASTVARFRHTDSHQGRIYKSVALWEWGDQVRITFFYRVAFSGPMLYIENHSRVVQPIAVAYRSIDNLVAPKPLKKFGLFIANAFLAPFICVGNCFWLVKHMSAASEDRKLDQQERKKIEEQARYNYGTTSSLRESFSSSIYDHYFEKSDRDFYMSVIQKQLLDSILGFLEEKNVDTSDLKDQRTYIINSGLIVHGGLQAGALAVGEAARASNEKAPKAKKAAGGRAA